MPKLSNYSYFKSYLIILKLYVIFSGLENEMLMNIKPFTATDAEMLNHFIDRLPSPVCIVAHNGYKFDFPILQKHLHQLNIVSEISFPKRCLI